MKRLESYKHTVASIFLVLLVSVVAGSALFLRGNSTAQILSAQLIGVSAGVEPNSVNALAEDLRRRSVALDERERLLQSQTQSAAPGDFRTIIVYFGLVSTMLFGLILVNYYLDMKRDWPARFGLEN